MKKYILLFALVFAMAGMANAQTTDTKSTATKVEATQKVESAQKATSADKVVTEKVAKTGSCKEMSSGCCKKGGEKASAGTEKACCSNMAEAKEGKACCEKKAEKMKAETKTEATKKG